MKKRDGYREGERETDLLLIRQTGIGKIDSSHGSKTGTTLILSNGRFRDANQEI